MSYKIEKIDKENISDVDWEKIYEYINKCSKIRDTDFKEESLSEFKSSFTTWLNDGEAYYLVWKNDKAAGFFYLQVFILDKKQIIFNNNLIEPNIEDELLKIIFECFLDYDSNGQFLYIESKNEAEDLIPAKLAVKEKEYRVHYELDVSSLNEEELLNNLNRYQRQYSDYSLKFYDLLPDEVLKSYCSLYVELCRETPGFSGAENYTLTEEELKEQQESTTKFDRYEFRFLLYDPSSNLIGVTSLIFNKENPIIGYQHFTGILKEYRGKGFSKYLKLAMLLKLKHSYPSINKLETEIAKENNISIQMNESMGYKQKGRRKAFSIPKEKIKDWLVRL